MFRIEEIVFARLEGYPFWPARVIAATPEHLTSLSMKKIPANQRLVLFYNDNGCYAAVNNTDLRQFDDPTLTRKIRIYKGPQKLRLRTAYEQALSEHQRTQPNSHPHSSTPNSPQLQPRPKKPTSSDLTSPVTGHSEPRQIPLPKRKKPRNRLTNRTPSSPPPPPRDNLPRKLPTSRNMASRTNSNTRSSPSNLLPQPSTADHSAHDCVQLRLRLKRNSTSSDQHTKTPASDPASERTEEQSPRHVSKRRRVAKSHPGTAPHQFPPHNSDHQRHDDGTNRERTHGSDHDNVSLENHTRLHKTISRHVNTDEKRPLHRKSHSQPSPRERDRTPIRLNDRNEPLPIDESREHLRDGPPTPSKTPLEQEGSNGIGAEQLPTRSDSEQDFDVPRRRSSRKRSSRSRTLRADSIEVDVEPESKERHPASKRNLNAERPRRSYQIQRIRKGDDQFKRNRTNKPAENRASVDSEQMSKSTKRKKIDGALVDPTVAFHSLSKDQCIELIMRMQFAERCNCVEVWRRGYEHADAKDIVRTEEALTAACGPAIEKAEKLLQLMKRKSEKEEKKGILEVENEACEACKVLRQVYFDTKKVSLKKLGKRMLCVAKELGEYSRKVSTTLRDLLVMWIDLTEGETQEELKAEEEKVVKVESKEVCDARESGSEGRQMEKRSPGKKSSAKREKRLEKFDRKSFYDAFETLLGRTGRMLEMDSKDRSRFARRLEKEIRPTFEEDKLGYYRAALNVIRGIQKVLKHLAVKGKKDEGKMKYEHTEMFVKVVKDRAQGNNNTRLLVTRLNGR